MSRTLQLNLPDNVYRSLAKKAQQIGETPETLAIEWLSIVAKNISDDPIEQFIGAFDSGGTDWADQHDKYFGESNLDD